MKKRKSIRKSQADLMRNKRAAESELVIPECANASKRNRLEKNPEKWLKYYLDGWFSKDFSDNQKEIIGDLERKLNDGGFKCVAMDRGGGKTTIGKGMVLKGILTGQIRFAFCGAATSTKATDDFIKPLILTLETNKLLIEDYPEVCVPFVALAGKALRAGTQTVKGRKTFISITGGIVFPTVDGSRCSGSVFKADGLTSSARGAQHTTADGELIRPDFIFFDDPQTDESASSTQQTRKREKIITSMVGMAGPGEKMAGYMACTVIEHEDLSSMFLDRKRHPEWYGTIYRMVNQWPVVKETLWEDYIELRKNDMEDEDYEFTASLDFYKEHFDEMNEGAEVAWGGRQMKGDLTAIQSAFHLVIEVGGWHTFMAEYQNDPIDETSSQYTLTPDIVKSRVNYMDHLFVQPAATIMTGFGDINHVGINYAVISFCNDLTGNIVDYGKFPEGRAVLYDPEKSNKTTEAQAITQGIFNFVRMMAGKMFMQNERRVNIDYLQIDGNYMTETVYNAVEMARVQLRPPFNLIVNHGRGYTQYRVPRDKKKLIGKPGDHAHAAKSDRGRQIVQDSDYWRMATQKALILEPGIPGSLSIYGKNPRQHERLADEICSEKLANYAVTDKGAMYKWNKNPSVHNDLLDAVVGCYSAASVLGASLTGGEQSWRKRKPKPRRKCRQSPE